LLFVRAGAGRQASLAHSLASCGSPLSVAPARPPINAGCVEARKRLNLRARASDGHCRCLVPAEARCRSATPPNPPGQSRFPDDGQAACGKKIRADLAPAMATQAINWKLMDASVGSPMWSQSGFRSASFSAARFSWRLLSVRKARSSHPHASSYPPSCAA
jgi:hypothetical protein